MTILTFSVLEDKILNGTKLQTTRYNAEYWLKRWHAWLDMGIVFGSLPRVGGATSPDNWKNYLHIWWLGPRSRNPAAYQMGIGRWFTYDMVPGDDLNEIFAQRDGFISLESYLVALGSLHKMSRKDVQEHLWGIIDWRWVEGPSKPKKVA